MLTAKRSGNPTPIYVYLDGDGTIYPDLQLYLGLGFAIPEMGYFPKWTGEQLNQHFVRIQQEIKEQRRTTGETFTGVDVVNGELCELAKDGTLEGLSNAVIREVGRRTLRLHSGVVDFMKDAREIAQEESEGLADVRFVINSSNLREGLLGSELGALAEGHDPLVVAITGQSFREKNGVIAYTQRTFTGESKADILHEHLADGVVAPENVIVVADGMTDRMLFRANREGMNVLVNDMRDPDKFAALLTWSLEQPNILGPLPAYWEKQSESEQNWKHLYLTLTARIRSLAEDIARSQRQPEVVDSRARLGTYADPKQSRFRERLNNVQSSRNRLGQEPIFVLNADRNLARSARTEAVLRAAALSEAPIAVEPRTARELVSGSLETTGHSFTVMIPSKGQSDRAIRKFIGLLSNVSAHEIQLPDTGSRGYDTPFGRVAVRRSTPEQSRHFAILSGEVANGTHAGFQVKDLTIPFWVPNSVLERALETSGPAVTPEMNGHGPVRALVTSSLA